MAQYLKDDVARRICDAALSAFAERGVEATSVAQIARLASVSTGNVYRYFENKEVLFRAVVPPSLARRLLALLRARVRSLALSRASADLISESAHRAAAEELLAFSIRHRLEVVILLRRAEGTPYAGFADKVEKLMTRLAVFHYLGADGGPLDPGALSVLTLVYQNWTRAMAQILAEHADEVAIRERVARFTHYHLNGLDAFFDALASGVGEGGGAPR